MDVLGMATGAYKVRVIFTPHEGSNSTSSAVNAVVFVTVDGEDFEIVGHAVPSAPGRKKAADSSSAEASNNTGVNPREPSD